MIWSELVRMALLGGERSNLQPELKQKFEAYGIHTDAPFPDMMLESAALFNQIRKAAFPLETYQGILPPPIPETEGTACSSLSTAHLRAILNGRYGPALSEFIFHLSQNQKKIPAEALPDLFNASLQDQTLWELLRPVIGKRGEWLLQQWPDWRSLAAPVDHSKWPMGSKEERLTFLSNLRKSDPAQALNLLKNEWNNLPAADKLSLLKTLEENISQKEEAFLEEKLDEGLKNVRLEAARLLACISTSALIDRLFVTLLDFIVVTDHSLTFEIPENLPESTLRDGIFPIPMKGMKGGLKAAWLRQIVGRIPPERWSDLLDKDAESCLPFFANSSWNDHLIPAIAEAILLHKDENWRHALMAYFLEHGNKFEVPVNTLKKIIQDLPPDAAAALAEDFLEKLPRIVENKSLFYLLITEHPYAWTDQVSITLVQNFKDWMRGARDNFHVVDHYREIFEAAAYAIAPQLSEKFKIGWPMQAGVWYYWEDAIDKFIRILSFRKEMIRALRN